MVCSFPGFPYFGLVPKVPLQWWTSVNCPYSSFLLVEQMCH